MTSVSTNGIGPAIILSLFCFLAGCGEETIDLTPMAPPTPNPGVLDGGTPPVPAPDMGDLPSPILYPDEARFESVVIPILLRHCGAGCHQNSVVLDNNDIPNGNQFEFDDSDISASIEEFLHPNYSNPDDPP